jgi:hypothetical protein
LTELLSREVVPEPFASPPSSSEALSEPIVVEKATEPRAYEADVFNLLLTNRRRLGINRVFTFKALLVDGALELVGGDRLAVEVKFRMNWAKACQAEWQFRNFLKRDVARELGVRGGFVFFAEFTGDWNKKAPRKRCEDGWNRWYTGHHEVDGLRLDLLRLRGGELQAYPQANP